MNVRKHEIFEHKKWQKKILLKLLRKKSFRKSFFYSDFFYQQILSHSPIQKKRLEDFIKCPKVRFENFFSRNGNLSFYEMMVIAALIATSKPKRLLEIGTFDGNTTLQMALNAPDDAIIHTLDLPPGEESTKEPVLESDVQFIQDEKKQRRKFEDSSVVQKIHQYFGDSTALDFSVFTKEGPLDFIFIDGGHSYECVKSDTERAFAVLSSKGCIMWHDFTPHFGGVFRFLCELSQTYSLIHIEGTNLVYYVRED